MSIKFENFDSVVIGGGFYGCILALHLKKRFKKVILLEKESDLLLKASYNNQARIHNGYHYPRSFITALRSHINYKRFVLDFKPCVVDNFLMVYAIAKNSKVTSTQFLNFCGQIGAPIKFAPPRIKKMFNNQLIEDAFIVEEAVFDAHKLRQFLKKKLLAAKVKILYKKEVVKVSSSRKKILIHLSNGQKIVSNEVLNCAYSNINTILRNSKLPVLPLKLELTEMPLLQLPDELKKMSITIMDGPFFSVMPFPDKELHTMHHVRYTPQHSILESNSKSTNYSYNFPPLTSSNSIYMIKDAQRYVPLLQDVKYRGSLYETKTLLLLNEISDARPILFRKDYGIKNFAVVMGGKIDNIYDIVYEMGL